MSKELYEQYIRTKDSTLEDRINTMSDLIREYPKLMDYITNKVDSCYGVHRVYMIHMMVNDIDMIKIGYTKNSVEGRFGEKRYAGRDNLEIVNILRQDEFQAKGAVDFERTLKTQFTDYKVTTDLTLPGKGEFYNINYVGEMSVIYDRLSNEFNDVYGLKSPN